MSGLSSKLKEIFTRYVPRDLAVVPEHVAHDVRPVGLVDHETVDAVVVGAVVVEPHAAVQVRLLVPRHVHAGPEQCG